VAARPLSNPLMLSGAGQLPNERGGSLASGTVNFKANGASTLFVTAVGGGLSAIQRLNGQSGT